MEAAFVAKARFVAKRIECLLQKNRFVEIAFATINPKSLLGYIYIIVKNPPHVLKEKRDQFSVVGECRA